MSHDTKSMEIACRVSREPKRKNVCIIHVALILVRLSSMQRKERINITAIGLENPRPKRCTRENKVKVGLWCARPSSKAKRKERKLGLR